MAFKMSDDSRTTVEHKTPESNKSGATLYKWQRLGWVHSRKVEGSGGRWAIWADDDA